MKKIFLVLFAVLLTASCTTDQPIQEDQTFDYEQTTPTESQRSSANIPVLEFYQIIGEIVEDSSTEYIDYDFYNYSQASLTTTSGVVEYYELIDDVEEPFWKPIESFFGRSVNWESELEGFYANNLPNSIGWSMCSGEYGGATYDIYIDFSGMAIVEFNWSGGGSTIIPLGYGAIGYAAAGILCVLYETTLQPIQSGSTGLTSVNTSIQRSGDPVTECTNNATGDYIQYSQTVFGLFYELCDSSGSCAGIAPDTARDLCAQWKR